MAHADIIDTTVMIRGVKCLRCDYQWVPRVDGRPTCCSSCKSPYWDQLPREKPEAKSPAKRTAKR